MYQFSIASSPRPPKQHKESPRNVRSLFYTLYLKAFHDLEPAPSSFAELPVTQDAKQTAESFGLRFFSRPHVHLSA